MSATYAIVGGCELQVNEVEHRKRRTVEVTGSLEIGVAEAAKGLERLGVAPFHHVPTRGLWTQVYLRGHDECGDTSLFKQRKVHNGVEDYVSVRNSNSHSRASAAI